MKESEKLGLLSSIVQMLREAGSWTGRMHIQKLVYFAQELLGLPSNYEFVLYQRGPYSFDLDADIRSLRSIGTVEISPAPPYGPRYGITELGRGIVRLSPVGEEMNETLADLAERLGPKHAKELELLATTLYVMSEGCDSDDDIVRRVVSLKPQFDKDEAKKAMEEVREIREQFSMGDRPQH